MGAFLARRPTDRKATIKGPGWSHWGGHDLPFPGKTVNAALPPAEGMISRFNPSLPFLSCLVSPPLSCSFPLPPHPTLPFLVHPSSPVPSLAHLHIVYYIIIWPAPSLLLPFFLTFLYIQRFFPFLLHHWLLLLLFQSTSTLLHTSFLTQFLNTLPAPSSLLSPHPSCASPLLHSLLL